jgi:hypothetical protein
MSTIMPQPSQVMTNQGCLAVIAAAARRLK